jgi:phytoene dehydrogenase-like protein
MSDPDVLIVGAGLAGICCARQLQKHGIDFRILEASDQVGGRVRTDEFDGFLLDRGYQTLLTGYPEALDQLDYEALALRPFVPGAVVRYHGRFVRLTDPWREPGAFLNTLFSPIGTLPDKFRMWRLRGDLLRRSIEEIFQGEETSTLQALRRRGFSIRMIENFFKPFLGGILLDGKLTASSRLYEFITKMLAEGDRALPAKGIGAIPQQLAATLPADAVRFEARVNALGQGEVTLESGETLRARSIVLATEGPEAFRLLGYNRAINSRSVSCLYFVARESPIEEPILYVNGGSRGPINHVCVPNLVQPSYAPEGSWLVSVSVVGWPTSDDKILVNMVRTQLRRWFGLIAQEWRLLRIYRVHHAHPVVYPMEWQQPQKLTDGLYYCGDHRATPTMQGAMESGRLAAESLLRDLGIFVEPDQPSEEQPAEPAPQREEAVDEDDD